MIGAAIASRPDGDPSVPAPVGTLVWGQFDVYLDLGPLKQGVYLHEVVEGMLVRGEVERAWNQGLRGTTTRVSVLDVTPLDARLLDYGPWEPGEVPERYPGGHWKVSLHVSARVVENGPAVIIAVLLTALTTGLVAYFAGRASVARVERVEVGAGGRYIEAPEMNFGGELGRGIGAGAGVAIVAVGIGFVAWLLFR